MMKTVCTRRLLVAGFTAVALPASVQAATIVWDGTTDQNWTNGPQNTGVTAFPNNGSTGANWTIDAGPAGQVVTPDVGVPGGNMIDYLYSGHDWTINSATINEDVQVRLDGGSLNITNSTVSLLPSSANTTASLSGLNLGQSGNATTGVFTDSTVNLSRSNTNGRALGITNGSSLSLVNTTINLSTEPGGVGEIDIANANSSLSLDSNSAITGGGAIEVLTATGFIDFNNATADLAFLRLNAGGGPSSTDILLDFAGGTITVSDSNPLRGTAFEGSFNWTGAAGSGTVTHTDLSNNNNNLAGKIAQGFFSIDGTRINPTISNSSDWTNPANIAALNTELQSLAVNGKYFELTSANGEQVLSLVPEPGSLALLAAGGFLLARRRRHGA